MSKASNWILALLCSAHLNFVYSFRSSVFYTSVHCRIFTRFLFCYNFLFRSTHRNTLYIFGDFMHSVCVVSTNGHPLPYNSSLNKWHFIVCTSPSTTRCVSCSYRRNFQFSGVSALLLIECNGFGSVAQPKWFNCGNAITASTTPFTLLQ